jgi:hypothetical protein
VRGPNREVDLDAVLVDDAAERRAKAEQLVLVSPAREGSPVRRDPSVVAEELIGVADATMMS